MFIDDAQASAVETATASKPAASHILTLAGPGATLRGHQVTFTGHFDAAGQVRVGVYLGSSLVARTRTNSRGFFVARPDLFASGDYRARAKGLVSRRHHVRVFRPLLGTGAEGARVRDLVQRLDELGYAVPPSATTMFTSDIRQSVYAFQKAQGIAVDGVVGPQTRRSLRDPAPVRPRRQTPAGHIEVDTQRQLLLVVEGGRVAEIVNTSTAGIPGYHTPHGTFRVFRRVRGIDSSPLGLLYDPLYFTGGYAIHGSTNVPPHPASHGCVRVPIWEAGRLFEGIPHGETVYVY